MADKEHVGFAGDREGHGDGTWGNSANGGSAYAGLQVTASTGAPAMCRAVRVCVCKCVCGVCMSVSIHKGRGEASV